MGTSGFNSLQLEYIAQGKGVEPVEELVRFQIDEHLVGNPANVSGDAILGIEIITRRGAGLPGYRFYRAIGTTQPQSDDPNTAFCLAAVKLHWQDPNDAQKTASAFYTSGVNEIADTTVPVNPLDGRWLWVLLRSGGKTLLIYQLEASHGQAGPCDDLLSIGIDCANTRINGQKLTCLARGCPA